jgi:hypothetical protein
LDARDGAVVEALSYKPEGRGIDSQWCHWNFPLAQSSRPHYGPGLTQPLREIINLLALEFGIYILAHPVYKMRIIQESKKVAL